MRSRRRWLRCPSGNSVSCLTLHHIPYIIYHTHFSHTPDGVDTITRTYTFADFQSAFYFMTQSAQLVEKNQHHPNWTNLYNT
ncbi:hypothetical protein EON63_19305 [archaeon]|nr:MAG: hypothetical protein EON63_19305 [archaeon]